MTVNSRSKFSRMRGQRSHGWGAKKKHRGAGNRGGRGMAGSGKRADQKKPTILKLYGNKYFGRHGFTRPPEVSESIRAINVGELQERLEYYTIQKLVSKSGDGYVVDLDKLGYQKLLGGGELNAKIRVSAPYFSKSAISKVEGAGGSIVREDEKHSK